ncbi:MAG: ABC transporter ATP-binding protein [Acidobacteriaceae bacterium]|nr:ABC transporter ATP-binding protein [Acidobacteriaceae bacterium]
MPQPNIAAGVAFEPQKEARVAPATLGAAPVIDLRGLSVRLGNREVLRDVTCSFTGRTVGLLGPNGAGKSTLINTLLGFWPASAGSARVFGSDIRSEAKKIRALIGYMPENDAFISNMTAVSFIRLMAELSGLAPELALERAHEALFYVGLGEARYRKLGAYSLGMKQLAKLAQAIAHGPKLLILDEPTNGLDPPARQRMIRLVREMRDSREMHIVMCSHLLRDVEETCEEVVILKQGRVVHYSNLEDERRSNRRFLELELQGDSDLFVETVERLGCECAPGALNRLKLVLAENVEVADIYRVASEQNVQLRRLNFRRDTLEDIFLKAMENTDGRQ